MKTMTFRSRSNALIGALCAFLLLGALTSHANSQTTTGETDRGRLEDGRSPKDETKGGECDGKKSCIPEIKSLLLPIPLRFARGLQYEYKLIEQPGTVQINQGTGVGTVIAFLRNPQDNLQQHTLTLKFAELFPERLSLFKRGSEYLNKDPNGYPSGADEELKKLVCKDRPLITCLTKGGRWWQRFLTGASINVNWSQRALVQQQIIASPTQFGKEYQLNGGFTYDPAKLFINATSWKSTFDDVQKIDKATALLGASDAINGTPWKPKWFAFIFPKVEFKILSQFDFVRFDGALLEAQFPERALNTWTFTWDLTRVIPDTKNRIDDDALVEALRDLKTTLGTKAAERQTKRCVLYFDGDNNPRNIDVQYGFSAGSCQKLAQTYSAQFYELACVAKDAGGVEVLDSGGKNARSNPPTKPKSGNNCGW